VGHCPNSFYTHKSSTKSQNFLNLEAHVLFMQRQSILAAANAVALHREVAPAKPSKKQHEK